MASSLLSMDWVGTLPSWAIFVSLIIGALAFRKGFGGSAIESLQIANEVLEKENKQLKSKLAEHDTELARLRTETNVSTVIGPVADSLVERLEAHEGRAEARFESAQKAAADRTESLLTVLDLIAKRLGPDANGEAKGAAA